MIPAWLAGVLLAGFVWLLATGLVWANSPLARREFPGGPVRLFVGQAVFCSAWTLCLAMANIVRDLLSDDFGLSRWPALWAAVGLVAIPWLTVRLAVPYTRRAASDWERWRSTPLDLSSEA